jgi:large subunit ribosomal protein L30
MKKFKVTQIKSGIDRPERQKLTLQALGLTRLNASREVEATPQILGMIRAVNHLITVEDVSTEQDLEGTVGPVEETAPVENKSETGTFAQLEESTQVAEVSPAEETAQADEVSPAQEESQADAANEEEKEAGQGNA